jgi:hypothetical protein
MEDIAAKKPKTLVLQVLDGIQLHYVEIQPIWPAN